MSLGHTNQNDNENDKIVVSQPPGADTSPQASMTGALSYTFHKSWLPMKKILQHVLSDEQRAKVTYWMSNIFNFPLVDSLHVSYK